MIGLVKSQYQLQLRYPVSDFDNHYLLVNVDIQSNSQAFIRLQIVGY